MPRLQCLSCQGVYSPTLADTGLYAHACPPLSQPEYDGLSGAEKVTARPGGPRKDHRDETLLYDPQTKQVTIKSEGKGAVSL